MSVPQRTRRSKPRKDTDTVHSSRNVSPRPQKATFGEDFIAFDSNDGKGKKKSDEEMDNANTKTKSSRSKDPSSRQHNGHIREWDAGKKRERDSGARQRGQKRKHGMITQGEPSYKSQRSYDACGKAPWSVAVDWDSCSNVAEMLHQEVAAFVDWISPTPEEDEVRSLVVAHITQAIQSNFPDALVLPFGSYQTKLYLPSGDIDLVVLSQSMALSNKANVLNSVASAMRRYGITDTKVTVISRAKVPIVKFISKHGRFAVDISINQENGVISGGIINAFLNQMQGCALALRSLVLITKAFLSSRQMNEVYTGGLGSYSIVCMAISFLQMHPKIRQGEIDAEKNLGVLVMEFFELYGHNFNYIDVGISVLQGGTYFSKAQRWGDYMQTRLLSIEDPADPTNDISKGSFGFPKVRLNLAGAHDILKVTMYARAGIIAARRESQPITLREQHPSEMSILSSFMTITQETLNHRKIVQELYDSGLLHRITRIAPRATARTEVSRTRPKDGDGRQRSMELESDSDSSLSGSLFTPHSTDEDSEAGRYSISRRKQDMKRRKTATFAEATSDDDD